MVKSIYDNFVIDDMKKEVWFKLLEDLSFEVASKALQQYMLTETFPPTPAHIRKNALEIIKGPTIMGAEAYSIIHKYLNLYSTREDYERLKKDYPDVYVLVTQIGGREILMGNVEFIRPQLIKLYDEHKQVLTKQELLPAKFKDDVQHIRQAVYLQIAATEEY